MEREDTYRFGDLLRGFRTRADMSQEMFARKLGVSRGAVYQWEKGNLPRLERIGEIAQALNLSDEECERLTSAVLGNVQISPSTPPAPTMPPSPPVQTIPPPSSSPPVTLPDPPIQTTTREKAAAVEQSSRQRPGIVSRVKRIFSRVPVEAVISAEQRKQNRQRMLVNVHAVWIKGVLEKSLYQTAPITLELRELPGVVYDPWQQEHREIDALAEPVRWSSAELAQMYEHTGGAFLLLGGPGSGKTTLLLELTNILSQNAQRDEHHPIPVFFNLSSWSTQELPLSEWLVKELHTRYQVPNEIGAYWVTQDQLLLLLDGLDEVAPTKIKACIAAINVYRSEHGLMPMVVCARSTNYLQQSERIALHSAVMIQPLTEGQVEDYLTTVGKPMDSARTILRDRGLQELVTTPLMLGILKQADAGALLKNVPAQASPEMQVEQILAIYVQRMFLRRKTAYTQEESTRWLMWLAGRLKSHNRSELYLEDLQSTWLPLALRYRIYPYILVGLVYGLFLAVAKGINYAVLQGTDQHGRSFGLERGILDGFIIGAGNTLFFVFLNGVIFDWLAEKEKRRGAANWRLKVINLLGTRLGYGLLNGLFNGLLIALLVDVPAGMYNGLFIGVIYAGLGKLPAEIIPTRVFTHWSWKRVRTGTSKFVGGGLFVGLLYGLFTASYWQVKTLPHPLPLSRLLPCLLFGLCVGLVIGLFIALMGGLSHDELDQRDTLRPNQGIWNSFWNSTISGIIVWIFFGLFFGLAYGFLLRAAFQAFAVAYQEYGGFFPRDSGLMIGFTYGLALAAFVWLSSGGTACMRHLLLRVLLWRERCTPWNYIRFLDGAAEQLLLRKVGGGYEFVHKTLLEYFASREAIEKRIS